MKICFKQPKFILIGWANGVDIASETLYSESIPNTNKKPGNLIEIF